MADLEFTDLPIITALEDDVDYFPFRDDSTGLDSRISPENMVKVFSQVGQLPFPAGAIPSADPNTLDDYEEGTWIPVYVLSTPGDSSFTMDNNLGRYQKIGPRVFIDGTIRTDGFTNTTGIGALLVNGLPFTVAAPPDGSVVISISINFAANENPMAARPYHGQSHMYLHYKIDAGNSIDCDVDSVIDGLNKNEMYFSGSYST